MSRDSGIQYVDDTINPTTGCVGCELWSPKKRTCYAGILHETRLAKSLPDLYDADFQNIRLAPGRMEKAARAKDLRGTKRPEKPWLNDQPRVIFVGNMGDLWSPEVPDEYIGNEVLGNVTSKFGHRHYWLFFTKQATRMREFTDKHGALPQNSMALVSVTSQANVHRLAELNKIKATLRGVSFEPLLGPIDAVEWIARTLDWVIVGGESGKGDVQPMSPSWVRTILNGCVSFNVRFFMKQWGRYQPAFAGFPSEVDAAAICPAQLRKDFILPAVQSRDGSEAFTFYDVGAEKADRMLDDKHYSEMPNFLEFTE